jgi:DivIVA domain-containing protein
MDITFTPTRFSEGYDIDQVDDFLDRCEHALATGDGSVTAADVAGMRFATTRFKPGYAMEEVDDFLDSVLVPRFRELEQSAGVPAGEGAAVPSGQGAADASPAPAPHPAEQTPGLLSRLLGRAR